jgi:hypothetical protein
VTWDLTQLRRLDLPVEDLPLAELTWQLRPPLRSASVWFGDEGEAEPIDVTTHGGRWLILDGVERLRRAVALELPTVPVRKVPTWALPLIAAAS